MSFFKLGMDKIPEALTLALMLVVVIALFYLNIDLTYKIGIGALAFGVIFLTGLANQALKQQKEQAKKQ
jgi:uncharacterized membrane protein YGL010W